MTVAAVAGGRERETETAAEQIASTHSSYLPQQTWPFPVIVDPGRRQQSSGVPGTDVAML